MINKVLMSGYDDSGNFPVASIIPQFGGGLDRDTLKKRASIFDAVYDTFERKPKHTYIHLISVAAGEYYGPNSRADFYNGDSYEHELSQPEEGRPKVIVLKRGLAGTHNKTFMENGAAYTEHFSSLDGAEPQGYIVRAAINPEMHRGELIIGVETDKWAEDIHKLESGTPMKFSIGASAPYDICSVCGRVARKESDHCDHYKNMPGAVLADGSQVYVISDNCVFHDISRVKTPAEKIAFSIRKVASAGYTRFEPVGPANLNVVRSLCKTASAVRRFDNLCKLAAIEKEIIAQATADGLDTNLIRLFRKRRTTKGCRKTASGADSLRKFLDFANDKKVLGACCRNKYVLSPEEFIDLLVPAEIRAGYGIDAEALRSRIPGIFKTILHSDSADTICEDTAYDSLGDDCAPSLVSRVGEYCRENSVGDVVGSLLDSILESDDLKRSGKDIIIKVSTKKLADPTQALAEEYASYLMSAADRVPLDTITMTLLDNIIK